MGQITSIRLPKDLRKTLRIHAQVDHRSLNNEIEVKLRLALVAEQNPDLPWQFIKDILEAQGQKAMGLAKSFAV
jgi:plasmid stability protein